MELNGKPLKMEHVVALTEATKYYNQFYKARNVNFVEITAQEYLEQLIERQLEGLMQGVELEKAVEEDKIKKLLKAKERLGI